MNLPRISKRNYFALPAGLAVALIALSLRAQAGTPINKTVAATANGNVSISSVAGSVKITAWNRNQVHVGGTLSRDATRLAVEQTANGVSIRVVLPQHLFGNTEGSDLVIQLPAGSHLEANTVSADVAAAGLDGPVRLESVSGDLGLVSKSGDIHAKTVSGDVKVTGSAPDADVEANSISGEVRVDGISGSLHAGSVSGNVNLTGNNTLKRARVETTSGGIEFDAALAGNGDFEFHSVSGDVSLALPQVPAARFDATSFSGGIDTSFGPKPQRTSEFGPGTEWHYQSGSGKAEVRIQTFSGDIRVRAAGH